jgi:hypothetical protein
MVKILECQIPQVRSSSKYWNAKSPWYAHGQNIGELNPPDTIMVKYWKVTRSLLVGFRFPIF